MGENRKNETIKFIDLFCGLGGTRLGLESACDELGLAHECVLSSDKKPASQIAYKHNFGDDIEGDICKIDEKSIPDFDVLLGGFPCFAAGTKVRTDKGYVPIEDIKPGDMVLTHKSRYRKVIEVGTRDNAETVILRGLGGTAPIECTSEHPFLSRDVEETELVGHGIRYHAREEEWVSASSMSGRWWYCPWAPDASNFERALPASLDYHGVKKDGDRILGWWGTCHEVAMSGRKTTVYNMEVEEDNSYTANGIAVHNCQSFSRAGMHRGFDDTRGTMFFEIERILKEKKPTYVMLENVPELTTHDGGNTFKVIKEHLEVIGYSVSHKILDGTDFGVPQARKRTFICAILGDNPVDMDSIIVHDEKPVLRDILEEGIPGLDDDYVRSLLAKYDVNDLAGCIITDKRRGDKTLHSWDFAMHGEVSEDERYVLETLLSEHRKRKYADELGVKWRDGMPLNEEQLVRATGFDSKKLLPLLDDLTDKGYLMRKRPYCDESLEEREDLPLGWKIITSRIHFPIHRILGPDDVCITLTATDAAHIGVVDGDGIRKLTIRECLRLFGFPESYDLSCVSESKAYDLIGNSICVPVVAAVVKNMLSERF